MILELEVKVDTQQSEAALERLRLGLAGVLPPPLRAAFARLGVVYMAFVRRRFLSASRGDGTWQPLAQSTKLARLRKTKAGQAKLNRTKKLIAKSSSGVRPTNARALGTLELAGSSFEILRDTNILYGSLSVGAPGNVQEFLDHGLKMGTNVFYGRFHQDPSKPGHPPQRLIVVDPDLPTELRMRQEVEVGIQQVREDAGL